MQRGPVNDGYSEGWPPRYSLRAEPVNTQCERQRPLGPVVGITEPCSARPFRRNSGGYGPVDSAAASDGLPNNAAAQGAGMRKKRNRKKKRRGPRNPQGAAESSGAGVAQGERGQDARHQQNVGGRRLADGGSWGSARWAGARCQQNASGTAASGGSRPTPSSLATPLRGPNRWDDDNAQGWRGHVLTAWGGASYDGGEEEFLGGYDIEDFLDGGDPEFLEEEEEEEYIEEEEIRYIEDLKDEAKGFLEEQADRIIETPIALAALETGLEIEQVKHALMDSLWKGIVFKDSDELVMYVTDGVKEGKAGFSEDSMLQELTTKNRPGMAEGAQAAASGQVPWKCSSCQGDAGAKESRTCVVCLEREVNVVFLPCRHGVCCVPCSQRVRDCPNCRENIGKKFVVYFS